MSVTTPLASSRLGVLRIMYNAMKDYILPIILGILGSGAFLGFVQFLINFFVTRHDLRKGITAQRVDRNELMMLIADYPRKVDIILKLAEHYFVTLKADSFLQELFADWLKAQGIDEPEWFKGVK